jgi:hypothetical protein
MMAIRMRLINQFGYGFLDILRAETITFGPIGIAALGLYPGPIYYANREEFVEQIESSH